jgi:hypothetical protein
VDSSGNIATNTPAFVDRTNYDYHLTAASPGIDKGVNPGLGGGFSLTPVFQYVYNLSGQPRTITGNGLDVGALEFSTAGTLAQLPRLTFHKTGRSFRLGANPEWDILGRSMPENKKSLSRSVRQIGVVEKE